MKGRGIVVVMCLIVGSFGPGLSLSQSPMEFHGADSVFERQGMTLLWGILKGKDEESSWACLYIVRTGKEGERFRFFSVEAVDPFSNEREWIVRGEKLRGRNMVKSPRSSFAEKTMRRIHFFTDSKEVEEGKAEMVVFYRSLPDTAPEFLSEGRLQSYFEEALRMRKKD